MLCASLSQLQTQRLYANKSELEKIFLIIILYYFKQSAVFESFLFCLMLN